MLMRSTAGNAITDNNICTAAALHKTFCNTIQQVAQKEGLMTQSTLTWKPHVPPSPPWKARCHKHLQELLHLQYSHVLVLT